MTQIKTRNLLVVMIMACTLAACHASAPVPGAPNSPQVQTHNINKTFADSINAAVKVCISLRDQGKLSPAITKQVEDWAVAASVVSDKIEMEVTSTDPWPVQKQKILVILTGFKIPNPGPVENDVQAALVAVQITLDQLRMEVAQ